MKRFIPVVLVTLLTSCGIFTPQEVIQIEKDALQIGEDIILEPAERTINEQEQIAASRAQNKPDPVPLKPKLVIPKTLKPLR